MRKQQECDFKKSIAGYVKSNTAGEEIKNHLQTCADCCETEKIMRFLQTSLTAQQSMRKLPTAGFIWWKAQLLNKRQAAKRAAQPLFIAQISAVIVAFLVSLWLLWTVPTLGRAAGQLANSIEQILPFFISGLFAFIVISLAAIYLLRRFLFDK